MIRQQLDVEVIEIRGSIYRTLAFLYEDTAPETRIAITGFRQLMNFVEPICDILGRTYQSFEIRDSTSFSDVIREVKRWKPDIVIGDAVSFHWAKDHGLNAYLIESSMETIVDAFERAMLVLNNLKRHIMSEKRLSAVLDCTKEGAILVDIEGNIEEINRQGCNILGAAREDLFGNAYSKYFISRELNTAFESKQEARNIILNCRGKRLAIDHIAVSSDDAVSSSAVILFQQIERIQETGNAIRKKLVDKGFYAKFSFADIWHKCDRMKHLVEMGRQYSRTDSNIMIMGETGTGKELFAQSIHNAGPLADGPYVAVNCAALSGSLLESELFGYAPGAFTGALRSGKTGLFELANDGTLFLDELSEMDIFLQSKLLRALQTREIMKIGDNKVIPINVRIIAATNKQPMEEVKNGKLRTDLYYRLNVLDLQIPPLRERKGEAVYLFSRFLEKISRKRKQTAQRPSARLLDAIDKYAWPGNVRELENFAEKYVTLQIFSRHGSLHTTLLPITAEATENGTLDEIISNEVLKVYKQENGNVSRTAQRLAIDRNTVKRWLEKTFARF
jgi:transcriptional regulator with PAS, ATPase and Fis domain